VGERVESRTLPVRAGRTRAAETVRIESTRGFGRLLAPRELWRFRDVALQIAARDVKVRYRQTVLGAAWAVLQPVGTMVVFSVFFGRLAHLSSEGASYPLFSLSALVPWTYFSTALLLGSDSLVANGPLVSKVYFPRIFIPAGVVAAGLVDLTVAFIVLLVVAAASGAHLSVALLALPLLVAVTVAVALGVSAGLSALNVRYRDVRYVVPFAVQLWLFATPIAYPSTLLHPPWRTVAAINPMTGVVEGFRWAVLGTPAAPWTLIGISALSAALFLVAGLLYFDRVERRFADVI
jgi:homopolymeric O-antigen transport system permease protein